VEYIRLPSGGLEARLEAGKGEVVFRAEGIRMEKTGVHGDLAIGAQGLPLSEDTFNVTREKDRTAAINKFYKRLGSKFGPETVSALNSAYPQVDLELDFMVFCKGLWGEFIGGDDGGWVDGDAEPSSPPWAAKGLILKGATNIWYGPAGGGKSTLLRLAAQSINYGIDTLLPVFDPEIVVWVNAEEPPDEHTRQVGNVNQALGIDRASPLYTLDARGRSVQDIKPRVFAAVEKTGAKHVFIDSLSRLAQGMNLNDNATATLLVDAMAGLDASVTWIGHTGQANTHRLAHSKHFENAARLMVRIESRPNMQVLDLGQRKLNRGLRATVYKANGAGPSDPLYWSMRFHSDYGLTEASRSTYGDWPMLECQGTARGSQCMRPTWSGINADGEPRCARHLQEDEED
jgi:hypothetical protein